MSAGKIVSKRHQDLESEYRRGYIEGLKQKIFDAEMDRLHPPADSIREQLEAAINAIHQTGHQVNCKFQGCTCGQVEEFAVARGTFIKLWQPFLGEKRG